mmetsp:Transcript_24219/g.42858  ORF Transcript_24219/g.42858 Transcript_24219/m.42858 type:complete len:326 (-) Transcript_24219:13-990(-)
MSPWGALIDVLELRLRVGGHHAVHGQRVDFRASDVRAALSAREVDIIVVDVGSVVNAARFASVSADPPRVVGKHADIDVLWVVFAFVVENCHAVWAFVAVWDARFVCLRQQVIVREIRNRTVVWLRVVPAHAVDVLAESYVELDRHVTSGRTSPREYFPRDYVEFWKFDRRPRVLCCETFLGRLVDKLAFFRKNPLLVAFGSKERGAAVVDGHASISGLGSPQQPIIPERPALVDFIVAERVASVDLHHAPLSSKGLSIIHTHVESSDRDVSFRPAGNPGLLVFISTAIRDVEVRVVVGSRVGRRNRGKGRREEERESRQHGPRG